MDMNIDIDEDKAIEALKEEGYFVCHESDEEKATDFLCEKGFIVLEDNGQGCQDAIEFLESRGYVIPEKPESLGELEELKDKLDVH